jgi:Intracellular proteinase inhibitor
MWKSGGAALCGAALLACSPRPMSDAPRPTVTVVAPATARAGEPVAVTVRLANPGTKPLTLYVTGRSITFDVIVATPRGAIVWHRLEGAAGQQILQVKTLAPGEVLELSDTWTAAAPGDYTVQGVVPTDGAPLTTKPVRLRITPR